jgi:hypothetical protein
MTSLPIRFGASPADRDTETQRPVSATGYVRLAGPITTHQSHPSTRARLEHEYERCPGD